LIGELQSLLYIAVLTRRDVIIPNLWGDRRRLQRATTSRQRLLSQRLAQLRSRQQRGDDAEQEDEKEEKDVRDGILAIHDDAAVEEDGGDIDDDASNLDELQGFRHMQMFNRTAHYTRHFNEREFDDEDVDFIGSSAISQLGSVIDATPTPEKSSGFESTLPFKSPASAASGVASSSMISQHNITQWAQSIADLIFMGETSTPTTYSEHTTDRSTSSSSTSASAADNSLHSSTITHLGVGRNRYEHMIAVWSGFRVMYLDSKLAAKLPIKVLEPGKTFTFMTANCIAVVAIASCVS
jgi:hypothetical protein